MGKTSNERNSLPPTPTHFSISSGFTLVLLQAAFLGGLLVSSCLSWNCSLCNFLPCWAVHMHYLARASQQPCEIIMFLLILEETRTLRILWDLPADTGTRKLALRPLTLIPGWSLEILSGRWWRMASVMSLMPTPRGEFWWPQTLEMSFIWEWMRTKNLKWRKQMHGERGQGTDCDWILGYLQSSHCARVESWESRA